MKPWKDKRGRLVCGCMGYHFPHRKGGGACDHSPRVEYYIALRAGEPEALALLWADKLERMPTSGQHTTSACAIL